MKPQYLFKRTIERVKKSFIFIIGSLIENEESFELGLKAYQLGNISNVVYFYSD